jgi:hypothetical protein
MWYFIVGLIVGINLCGAGILVVMLCDEIREQREERESLRDGVLADWEYHESP